MAVQRRRSTILLAALGVATVISACGATFSGSGSTGAVGRAADGASRTIRVVAAENFWGSIAAQLGGPHVEVTSIIDSPDADPHDYEPTAADGRAIATADLVLDQRRRLRHLGEQARGGQPGTGPHRCWPSATWSACPTAATRTAGTTPTTSPKVVDQLTPTTRRPTRPTPPPSTRSSSTFRNQSLAEYTKVIAEHQGQVRGTPVGASESIFAMVAPALGLDLRHAADVPQGDQRGHRPDGRGQGHRRPADQRRRRSRCTSYNTQNATPDVQAQVERGQGRGHPGHHHHRDDGARPTASWQDWQTRQLAAAARRPGEGDRPLSDAVDAGPVPTTPTGPAPRARLPDRRSPSDFGDAAVRVGGRTLWAGVDVARRRPGSSSPVLGPNGAGKSTLIKAMLGLIPLSPGTLTRSAGRRPATGNEPDRLPAAAAQLRRRGSGSAASTSSGWA